MTHPGPPDVAKVKSMNQDIAERFAATAVDGITVAQARTIIREFLSQIARCPVCNDTGRITFGRDMEVKLMDNPRHANATAQWLQAGSETDCPRCGPPTDDGRGKGDPLYVAWHCSRGEDDQRCHRDRLDESGRRQPHSKCSYRVMLPLDLFSTTDSPLS